MAEQKIWVLLNIQRELLRAWSYHPTFEEMRQAFPEAREKPGHFTLEEVGLQDREPLHASKINPFDMP